MKSKLFYFVIVVLSILFANCQSSKSAKPADKSIVQDENVTIYHGGTIITMEGDEPEITEAVVVVKDQIAFVGSFQAAKKTFPQATDYELQGKTMLPGFIEPHVHPSIAVTVLPNEIIAPYDWDLPGGFHKGAHTKIEYKTVLKERIAKKAHKQELLLTWGYHQMWHGPLSREILNDLAGDQPIGVIHRSFHEFFVNDAAIALLKIKNEDFINNPQVDWENGHFYEGGWLSLVPKIAGSLFHPTKLQKGMLMMNELIHKNGITTIAEPGFPGSNFLLEYGMYKSNMDTRPPYDLFLIPNGTRLYHAQGGNEKAYTFIEKLDTYNSEQLKFLPKQVKLFADGAMYSQLMQMKDGYLDDHEGQWMTNLDLLEEQIKYYWNKGYKIHVHANGDLGIQELIDLVKPLKEEADFDHRFTLHHMAYFTPDQADQISSLRMEASVNPYYLWALSDKYAEEGLGKERAENLVRTNSLMSRDIPVSFHSDFSMAPLSPLTLAWVAVNRVTSSGKAVSQDECISVYEGLRAITIDAARTLNLENQVGSIMLGKQANFVLLEEDPLVVDPMKLKDISISSTIYNGEEYLVKD